MIRLQLAPTIWSIRALAMATGGPAGLLNLKFAWHSKSTENLFERYTEIHKPNKVSLLLVRTERHHG